MNKGDIRQYRFRHEVDEMLRRAGWYPGRAADVDRWRPRPESEISMHPAAERFLSEFGGLAIEVGGPDPGPAGRESFVFDPMDELGELGDEGRYADWGADIGHSLFPVGFFKRDVFRLAVDEDSVVYLVSSWLASYGPMPRAMERLVLGHRPRTIRAED